MGSPNEMCKIRIFKITLIKECWEKKEQEQKVDVKIGKDNTNGIEIKTELSSLG